MRFLRRDALQPLPSVGPPSRVARYAEMRPAPCGSSARWNGRRAFRAVAFGFACGVRSHCNGPALDFDSLARTETLVADFLRLADRALEDPELRKKLSDSLEPLFRRRDMAMPDDVKLREWMERATALGVDLLMES